MSEGSSHTRTHASTQAHTYGNPRVPFVNPKPPQSNPRAACALAGLFGMAAGAEVSETPGWLTFGFWVFMACKLREILKLRGFEKLKAGPMIRMLCEIASLLNP